MKITRDDVVTAIASETLIPNEWVEQEGNPGCRVCAVGAVLRRAGLANGEIKRLAPEATNRAFAASQHLNAVIGDGNWLGALSIQFERLCEKAPLDGRDMIGDVLPEYVEKTVKPALRAWVLATMPDGVIYED